MLIAELTVSQISWKFTYNFSSYSFHGQKNIDQNIASMDGQNLVEVIAFTVYCTQH